MPDSRYPTRRWFFQAAAAGAALPPAAAAPVRPSPFAPAGKLERLSDNLFRLEDTCHVYLIRDGATAVLIDFGSGQILDHLSELGIQQVAGVLHTHHHRDQCQGDLRAVARHIPIAVPQHERHLFEDAENFWRNRRVYHLYYVRNDFTTLTHNIPVAHGLMDDTTFKAGQREFFVLPTPGHTLGSITLLTAVDGRQVAFTGDLLHSPGKLPNLYDTQVNYGGSEGIDLGISSLARLRARQPDLLCPSHGEAMPQPDQAIAQTIEKMAAYYRFFVGEPSEFHQPYAVSPHLLASTRTMSSFYVIKSDSGKAMLIDYGSGGDTPFYAMEVAAAVNDRMRSMEHTIGKLQRDWGVQKIDVAMPSHIHDDHINGLPLLVRKYGTQIWCYDNMVDIFRNPHAYNLGCLMPEPLPIHRTFRHGETFRWEEFEFLVTHSPGHTEYQMALFVTLDGQRVAFTGDAFFGDGKVPGTIRHNLIFRNRVEHDSHLKSIRNLLAHEPALICPGHGQPYPVTRDILRATEQRLQQHQQFFFDLLPAGQVNQGLDPSWVSLYPYQMRLTPGQPAQVEVRVRNHHDAPLSLEVALIAPAEWRIHPAVLRFTAPVKAVGTAVAQITIPTGWTFPQPRLAIAADVRCDGKYLGQIAEAVVERETD